MSDVNVTVTSGRVTRDPELRYTPSGTAVMDLSIASNRMWSKDGERQEETTWVDATVWGKTAESLSNIIKKGTHLTVTGRLKTNSWTTPEGVNRSKLSVNADTISLSPRGKPEAVAVGADDSEVAF